MRRGSITKRCEHQERDWARCPHSWRVTISGGSDPLTGGRLQVRRTVRGSRRDAEREVTRLLREADDGRLADPGRTKVGEFLSRWLDHQASRVRPRTLERYRQLIEGHVTPRIGAVRLSQLRPLHVQQVVDGMLGAGSSPRTTLHAYRALYSALAQGVRWQILGTNPAAAVRPPRPERPTLSIPDAAMLQRIRAQAAGTMLEGPVTLAMATGMRLSEILGLRWRDVSLDEGLLRVTASLAWEGGRPVFPEPKTARARRTVALPGFAAGWLREYKRQQAERRLRCGEAWEDHDVVLDRGDGLPLRRDAVSPAFSTMVRRHGLGKARFHDLRHAYATALLMAGVHPKVVSEALGHSTVALTLDVYSHVLPSMGQAAADAIQRALGVEGR